MKGFQVATSLPPFLDCSWRYDTSPAVCVSRCLGTSCYRSFHTRPRTRRTSRARRCPSTHVHCTTDDRIAWASTRLTWTIAKYSGREGGRNADLGACQSRSTSLSIPPSSAGPQAIQHSQPEGGWHSSPRATRPGTSPKSNFCRVWRVKACLDSPVIGRRWR